MQSRRYHIHVICVAHSQPLVLDSLAMFFQPRAFLTYDVLSSLSQSALYGRQCVDACDYVLIIIGDSYDIFPNAVVSQMHLSYLSARSKSKPIMTLVKRQYGSIETSRQLQEFTRLVERQTSHVYYYDDNTDIKQLLSTAYTGMISNYELPTGWIKADRISDDANKIRMGRVDLNAINLVQSSNDSVDHANTNYVEADYITRIIELSDTFEIEYNAQAYEGGNLTDVVMPMTLQWRDILLSLANMPAVFSNYGLQSMLNRSIAVRAEHDVKQLMPKVHAVARSQITKKHLDKLQRLLIAANWIEIKASGSDVRETKELWSLTFYAKNLFEQSQMNSTDAPKM